MRLPPTLSACVAGGIVSAIKMLAEELQGHVENGRSVLKFSRGFASHTRKRNSTSYASYHLGRVLSRMMHCISFALVKVFYGSITVIKLTTKVSKMKYHVLLYKHQ